MSNQNNDNAAGCVPVFIILMTGVFLLLGGIQFLKEAITDPQTAFKLNYSGYEFENDIALFGLIVICLWLGVISFLFGWIAMKKEDKIDINRPYVAARVTVSVLCVMSFAVSLTMFIMLVRYVDVLGEMIFPASDNLVWKSSRKSVTMAEQRGWGRILLMSAAFLAVAIGTAIPAGIAAKRLKEDFKYRRFANRKGGKLE